MEAVIYYARTDGIELERMIRKGMRSSTCWKGNGVSSLTTVLIW